MQKYIINGGKRLHGSIESGKAKNAALYIICAALMADQPTTLVDVPLISDIYDMIKIFQSMGAKVQWQKKNKLFIQPPKRLKLDKIDYQSCCKMRASLLLIGALVGNYKRFKIPKAGGCHLGKRTVKPHLFALEKLGVKIVSSEKYYEVSRTNLVGDKVVMYESGDTTTGNVIMAAVLAKGKTTIKFASANYMVQDLCYFLQKMGAKINGIGTTTLEITGVKRLRGVKEYPIMEDPIESMTWLAAGIATRSAITVKRCPLEFLELEIEKLKRMGQKLKISKRYKSKNGKFDLVDIKIIPSKLVAPVEKIYGQPYPGFNLDNVPFFVPICALAKGKALIFEWAYDARAISYKDFDKLGVKILILDAHRVLISGPNKFLPNHIIAPNILRTVMIYLIGMLAAKGQSVLYNITPVERGYEDVIGRLNKLGADIKKVDD
jgi:UDP-N-acetylglucosamine 1-carboxyvinyltransferase